MPQSLGCHTWLSHSHWLPPVSDGGQPAIPGSVAAIVSVCTACSCSMAVAALQGWLLLWKSVHARQGSWITQVCPWVCPAHLGQVQVVTCCHLMTGKACG
jgi:hypothetical protein